MPTAPATQHHQESPGDRPALVPPPCSFFEPRLQRPAGIGRLLRWCARKVRGIVARVICRTDFPRALSETMAPQQSRPRTAIARSASLNTANDDNEEHLSDEKVRMVLLNGAGTIARGDNVAASFAFFGATFNKFRRGEAHLYNRPVP